MCGSISCNKTLPPQVILVTYTVFIKVSETLNKTEVTIAKTNVSPCFPKSKMKGWHLCLHFVCLSPLLLLKTQS